MEYSMTETQTDPSPWDGLIERMQGRMMVAGQCSVEGPEDTASLMAQAEAEFLRECLNAIATARAAEAAQHQHEIAAKNAIIRTQAADLTTLKAGMKAQRDFYACEPWQSLETATARLAAVEAERDRLKASPCVDGSPHYCPNCDRTGYYVVSPSSAPAAQTPETTTDTVKPEVPNLMAALKKSLEQLTPTGEKDPR